MLFSLDMAMILQVQFNDSEKDQQDHNKDDYNYLDNDGGKAKDNRDDEGVNHDGFILMDVDNNFVVVVALWARTTKNTDWSTGPLACPFARSFARLLALLTSSRVEQ